MNTNHLEHLQTIADEDVRGVMKAEKVYGSSWKRRGGVGAYMMMCRKFDRIEEQLKKPLIQPMFADYPAAEALRRPEAVVAPYDIFGHAAHDTRSEGIIDDIRDLRRYLLLVESELRARGIQHGAHRDNAKESVKTCVGAEQALAIHGRPIGGLPDEGLAKLAEAAKLTEPASIVGADGRVADRRLGVRLGGDQRSITEVTTQPRKGMQPREHGA